MATLALLGALALDGADLRLIDAVRHRDRAAIEALARDRAALNATQPDGATALAWAVHLEDEKTAALLIGAGANVNAADEYGETPLTLACANGNAALVRKLLEEIGRAHV